MPQRGRRNPAQGAIVGVDRPDRTGHRSDRTGAFPIGVDPRSLPSAVDSFTSAPPLGSWTLTHTAFGVTSSALAGPPTPVGPLRWPSRGSTRQILLPAASQIEPEPTASR